MDQTQPPHDKASQIGDIDRKIIIESIRGKVFKKCAKCGGTVGLVKSSMHCETCAK